MSKLSRRKGNRYERDVARRLTDATGHEHKRILVETREGNVGDVGCESLPVVYQTKHRKRINAFKALDEALEAAGDGQHGVAWIKRDNGVGRAASEAVLMHPDDYLEMVGLLVKMGVWA